MKNACSPERQYRELMRQGRFALQKCAGCDAWIFYPRAICPQCGSTELVFTDTDGDGVVFSCTTVRNPNALGREYNISLIQLDVGCRLLSRVESIDPDKVRIGMKVKARIAVQDARPLLVFLPVDAGL